MVRIRAFLAAENLVLDLLLVLVDAELARGGLRPPKISGCRLVVLGPILGQNVLLSPDELKLVKSFESLLDPFDIGDGSLHGVHYRLG